MNVRFAFAGICLLLASSGLFAASSAPRGVTLTLALVAVGGAGAVLARVGADRGAA